MATLFAAGTNLLDESVEYRRERLRRTSTHQIQRHASSLTVGPADGADGGSQRCFDWPGIRLSGMPDLHARHFLAELDFTRDEWAYLLDLSAELKQAKRERREPQRLVGRNIVLIFEKTSTRTRCAFEVAAHDQGAHCTYLDPSGSQLGHKESVADTARVLGKMYDGIEYRGFEQERVETLARYAGVPVWNGLTDEWHPTQMLADQLTIREYLDAISTGLDRHTRCPLQHG